MRISGISGFAMSMTQGSLEWSKLAIAWKGRFLDGSKSITAALSRTMPLLAEQSDPTISVPFVCRYRTEIIDPLSTADVHQLAEFLKLHKSLESLRNRLLGKLPSDIDPSLRLRVETSLSKAELEDLYAPYKPPSKGSLEDRIQNEFPDLVVAVDHLWKHGEIKRNTSLEPREHAIILLANRIASHAESIDACQYYTDHSCRIKVSAAKTTTSSTQTNKKVAGNDHDNNLKGGGGVFQHYCDFDQPFHRLRDHQVLAIRRGVEQKQLKIQFDLDNNRAHNAIHQALKRCQHLKNCKDNQLWNDSIYDAWSRLLKKRCTSRGWKAICSTADVRAIAVFCDNLYKALLAPPVNHATPILALDPGFKAGIKIAMVDEKGQPLLAGKSGKSLQTIHFTGAVAHETAKTQLGELLNIMQQEHRHHQHQTNAKVQVVLGNGHGSQEARKLIEEASVHAAIPVDVHLVNEAGASVWSVTEAAASECPNESAASIAALSIARRYQNPLLELVKIPPRSLGLGMYQHDFAEKILDHKLNITSIDAVAEIGVDVNTCSLEILEKVPGISTTLAKRIVQARPIQSRQQLLQISGLGPKTFENCAAFLRVVGPEKLDRTLVHPESYPLARYLLKELEWIIEDPASVGVLPHVTKRAEEWKDIIVEAEEKFVVTDTVLSVINHLIRSIKNVDPRLADLDQNDDEGNRHKIGSPKGCNELPSNLATMAELDRASLPIRRIVGYVRNVVDFGIFVDFGAESDGMIHRSKLGPIALESFLVGQEIGVDILGVSSVNNLRVSLSLTGLELPADSKIPSRQKFDFGNGKRQTRAPKQSCAKRQRTQLTVNSCP